MPDLIRDNLVVRTLKYIANLCRLPAHRHLLQLFSLKKDFALPLSIRTQNGFKMPQKGGFSTAGFSADNHKFSRFNGKIQVLYRRTFCVRISKIQIFDFI